MSAQVRTKLEDLLDLPSSVDLPRGKLDLRGLGAFDLGILLAEHRDQFMAFFSGAKALEALAVTAPKMVAQIIAMAADRPDEMEAIGRMPIQVQADCLAAIYRLSVPDEKKFFQSLERVAEKLRHARGAMFDPSGSSVETSSPSTSIPVSGSVIAGQK